MSTRDTESSEQKEVERIVQESLDNLAEYCDSAHIFVTRYVGASGNTVHYSRGTGNWFSRFGQIVEWVIKQKEQTRKYVREETDDD